MASYIESLIDEDIVVSVITTEGKVYVGNLKSFDQSMNLILSDCSEKIYSVDEGLKLHRLGLYMIRGDTVAIVSQVDELLEAQINPKEIKAEPLNEMKLHN
jgi:U6 snRNA-associated Sm-like protein LSm8